MNLFLILLTGLTVGGLTCLAVQGGLLTSVIAAREEEKGKKDKYHLFYSTLSFLIAKLIAYTLLGFVLGAFGGVINISGNLQIFMQLIAGIYMILVALNLLEIHPIFRYAIIQPPKFLTRRVRNQSKSKDIFAPALLGAMTIFIPCGTTIGMEALAISSANALNGALIMFFFILGTVPLFFGLGLITSVLGDTFRSKFIKIAAILVIILGLASINGAFVAVGLRFSIDPVIKIFTVNDVSTMQNVNFNQNPTITITSSGYSPNYIRVKKGVPVTLTLVGKDAFSCASTFRLPTLGLSANLKGPNDIQRLTFTPQSIGQIPFNCSMGMYSGVIEVL